jgi:hypothetical protein
LGTFTATPKPLIDFRRPNIVVLSLVVDQEIPYCFEHGAVLATGKNVGCLNVGKATDVKF